GLPGQAGVGGDPGSAHRGGASSQRQHAGHFHERSARRRGGSQGQGSLGIQCGNTSDTSLATLIEEPPMRRCQMLAVLLLCAGTPLARSAPPAQLERDEVVIRQGNVQPDGAGLLEFLKSLTPGDKALEDIESLVNDLGSSSFKKRQKASEELMRIG